jgi:hypothetical protein
VFNQETLLGATTFLNCRLILSGLTLSWERTLMSEYNPFAVSDAGFDTAAAGYTGDAEAIRRELISHEASVKSIGALYIFGAVVGVGIGVVLLAMSISAAGQNGQVDGGGLLLSAGLMALIAFQGFVGIGLRQLRSWTRIPVGILSGIGLLGFPIGTLINGHILYLVFSEKGRRVFSPEYQEIIRQTPHVKYQTSIIVKIFVGLLLGVLLFILAGVVMSLV